MRQLEKRSTDGFIAAVQRVVQDAIREVRAPLPLTGDLAQLMPGKMLRTRLAARLAACGATPADRQTIERSCAAVEIVHTASLLHDDVIDNGLLRRAQPTLWTLTSPSASVLIGDLLLCKAMDLLVNTDHGRYVSAFVSKVREVCAAEAEQELLLRGRVLDESTCLRLARSKTGPLFAFVGLVSGGGDSDLSGALEEAGYLIGTAYQIFDDIVDLSGHEREVKKTLGTDLANGKFTLPQRSGDGQQAAVGFIESLCHEATDCLDRWPQARCGIEAYLECDLGPVVNRSIGQLYVSSGLCGVTGAAERSRPA